MEGRNYTFFEKQTDIVTIALTNNVIHTKQVLAIQLTEPAVQNRLYLEDYLSG